MLAISIACCLVRGIGQSPYAGHLVTLRSRSDEGGGMKKREHAPVYAFLRLLAFGPRRGCFYPTEEGCIRDRLRADRRSAVARASCQAALLLSHHGDLECDDFESARGSR